MPDQVAKRVIELFPQLVEASAATRQQVLDEQTPEVAGRLQRMLELEAVDLTAQTHATLREELSPPPRVGAFRLVSPLGRGGMGLVYLAEQDVPRRRVAVKLLRPILHGPAARRAFQTEVETLGQLGGNGIPFLIAAGFEGDWPWLAMEWVQGVHLDVWAETVDEAARLRALVTLARVVDRAHEVGLAHLDLKPANVLVGPRGLTVLDLGIARVSGSAGRDAGSPGWRAPEQLADAPVDVRSDVYALGQIGLRLLGAHGPTAGVLAQATAGAPEDRHPRAGAFAAALREARADVVAPAASAGQLVRRVALETRRHGDELVALLERARSKGGDLRAGVEGLARGLDKGALREEPATELRLRLLLVSTCLSLDQVALAERQADAAIALVPLVRDPVLAAHAHLERAAVLQRQYHRDDAEHALALAEDRLPEQHPLWGRLWFLRGQLAAAEGDTEGAVRCFEQALSSPSPPPDTYAELVRALALMGQPDRARQAADRMLSREQARFDGAPHLGLARAHGALAVFHGAGDGAEKALEHARIEATMLHELLGPDALSTQNAYKHQALAYLSLARFDEAVVAARAAAGRERRPANLLTLATALAFAGREADAEAVAREGLARIEARDPRSELVAMFRITLGEICATLGKRDEARTLLTDALAVVDTWILTPAMQAQRAHLHDLLEGLEGE